MTFGAAGGRENGELGSNGPLRASEAGDQLHPITAERKAPPAHQFGSQQLRLFRRARRDGQSIEEAAETAGISIGEARLHAADDAANPPPPEAFELLIQPDAPAAASPAAKEDEMARGRMAREPKPDSDSGEGAGINGEYARPDAAKAFDIYDKQIRPKQAKIDTTKGDMSQPWDDIKEQAHYPKFILEFILRLEKIDDDAKRDHAILALSEGFKHRKHFLPRDLVTMADGEDGGDIVGVSDQDDDDDLLNALDGDDDDADEDFSEASEAELAAQKPRADSAEKRQVEAQSSTGAAAISAMKKSQANEASAATH